MKYIGIVIYFFMLAISFKTFASFEGGMIERDTALISYGFPSISSGVSAKNIYPNGSSKKVGFYSLRIKEVEESGFPYFSAKLIVENFTDCSIEFDFFIHSGSKPMKTAWGGIDIRPRQRYESSEFRVNLKSNMPSTEKLTITPNGNFYNCK